MKERTILVFLLVLCGLLAGSTTFFATLHFSEKPQAPGEVSTTQQPTPTPAPEPASAPPPPETSAAPVNFNTLPSVPEVTYTVQKNDTLFSVASSLEVSADEIALANNLTDVNVIKFDQVLVIPKVDKTAKVAEITFLPNDKGIKNVTSKIGAGQDTVHKDPLKTAQVDHGGLYGLGAQDSYTLGKNDDKTADIDVKHADDTFLITVKKHEQGIWIVLKITRKFSS